MGPGDRQSAANPSPAPVPAQDSTPYDAIHRALWLRPSNLERIKASSIDAKDAFDLARMRALLKELGDPQEGTPLLHVAGSKGKGSICEMAASALCGCGYTVGLYTSPHLVDLRERVRVLSSSGDDAWNDDWISASDFAHLGELVLAAASRIESRTGPLSSFELLTALAFLHFAQHAVDVGVIEVGLGGLLDATNVITPRACALGAIQLEHTHLLGDTIEKIAAHKAGIMKAGVPAVSVPQHESVVRVFDDVAQRAGARFTLLGRELDFSQRFGTCPEIGACHRVSLMLPGRTYEHVPVPLPGEHQAANCAAALAMLHELSQSGFDLPEGKVVQGLLRTARAGRLEQVHDDPRVIVDGAHTPESVAAVVRTLASHLRPDSVVVVFGCHDDKNARGMLESIALGADKVILTRAAGNDRAMEPRELLRRHQEVGRCMAQQAPTVKDAINIAAAGAGRNDIILVTGSFAIAGEAKRLFLEKKRATAPASLTPPVQSELKPADARQPKSC